MLNVSDNDDKSFYSNYSSKSVVIGKFDSFYGYEEFLFNPKLIALLDRLFVNGSYQILSSEQEKFVREFVKYAGYVTDAIEQGIEMPRNGMPNEFLQFDTFLGSVKR